MSALWFTAIYFICVLCVFYTLYIVWPMPGERVSNLEMSFLVLAALLWPLELCGAVIAFILIGPFVGVFRKVRRHTI